MIRKSENDCGCDDVLSMDSARTTYETPENSTDEAGESVDSLRAEIEQLRRQIRNRALREIIGHTPAVESLRQLIAGTNDDEPILIHGAPGTDCDQVAEAIHNFGRRAHRPLVKLDCRLLSAERLEQELLARQSGKSLSAQVADFNSPSRFAAAAGGTILLKNIDAVPLATQRAITLFLREQRVCATVSDDRMSANRTRVLVSTHADLKTLVVKKQFRADLCEELNLRTVAIASLCERADDIGLIAEHYIALVADEEGLAPHRLTIDGLKLLKQHSWPGNDAELRRVIKRACGVVRGEFLTAEILLPWLSNDIGDESTGLSLQDMERRLIETTFSRCEGNREKTAQVLQIGLRTLSGKLREYGYPPRGGPGSNIAPSKLKAA